MAKDKNQLSAEDKAVACISLFKNTKGEFAGRPFNLQPWQEQIIRKIFRTGPDGMRVVREAFIFLPRKNGKDLALQELILTPGGWKTMGTLNEGDHVFGPDGKPARITYASEVYTDHECYEVEFADGRKVTAGAGHLWTVYDQYRERNITLETQEIARTYIIGNRPTHKERRYSVQRTMPVELERKDLPLDPYLLGAWLGNGTSACGAITSMDEWIFDAFRNAGYEQGCVRKPTKASTIYFKGLQTDLRAVGVLDNKHIPAKYLIGSIDQRRALLAGLIDTDGGVIGTKRQTRIEFSSSIKNLSEGVLFLARSLGFKATIRANKSWLHGVEYKTRYRVTFAAFRDESPFTLKRKTDRLIERPAGHDRKRSESVKITRVERVPTVPTRCIKVDREDGLFLAGEGLVPTHNTELAAAIALYSLLFDGEYGGEHYIAATDKDQASIAYAAVASMVTQDANLAKRCKVLDSVKRIVVPSTNSFLRAIPADAGGSDGFGAQTVIYDELHAAPNRDLYDVLRQSQGGRRQPLFISITTAGFDKKSVCYERYNYACQVRDGIVDDPTFLPVIYEAPKDSDWRDESTWIAANPGLQGDKPFRSLTEMRRFAKEAELMVGMQNTFRMKYLNQWTEQACRWIDTAAWELCGAMPESLDGRECFGALDLATTTDLCAFVGIFPADDGFFDVIAKFWCPREGARKRSMRDRVPYEKWIEQGWITATEGDVTDYDFIRKDIQELGEQFGIKEIAVDRWNATQITTQLGGDGFEMVPFGQGFGSMSAPSKELEKLVISKKLRHGNNPVLNWMAANVAIEQDAAGNIKPSKRKSTERIDGIVALVMAIGRAIASPTATTSDTICSLL